MALQVAAVGREPVDLAAQINLDGSAVAIENLGIASLWFLLAEAAGEAAPADRKGHLLEPGAREPIQPHGGAGFPLWVWSQHATAIGVGPRLDG